MVDFQKATVELAAELEKTTYKDALGFKEEVYHIIPNYKPIPVPLDHVVQLPPAIDKMVKGSKMAVFIANTIPKTQPHMRLMFLPPPSQFKSFAEFLGTLFHELTHSTEPILRSDKYILPVEEVIAEIGAVFLANAFDVKVDIRQSALYVNNWSVHLIPNQKEGLMLSLREAAMSTSYLLKL